MTCIRCKKPDEDIIMNFWRELTLCKPHKKEWKQVKKTNLEKIKIIDEAYDRLLTAIDEERERRKQIGKR